MGKKSISGIKLDTGHIVYVMKDDDGVWYLGILESNGDTLAESYRVMGDVNEWREILLTKGYERKETAVVSFWSGHNLGFSDLKGIKYMSLFDPEFNLMNEVILTKEEVDSFIELLS